MAKQGMKRMERTHTQPKNDAPPVPEIRGKAKSGKKKANPVNNKMTQEKKISSAYKEIDTDLARDNLENDIPDADLQDLEN